MTVGSTNDAVIRKAKNIAGKQINLANELHKETIVNWAAQNTRVQEHEPQRSVTSEPYSWVLEINPVRRIGRPRKTWARCVHEEKSEKIQTSWT